MDCKKSAAKVVIYESLERRRGSMKPKLLLTLASLAVLGLASSAQAQRSYTTVTTTVTTTTYSYSRTYQPPCRRETYNYNPQPCRQSYDTSSSYRCRESGYYQNSECPPRRYRERSPAVVIYVPAPCPRERRCHDNYRPYLGR